MASHIRRVVTGHDEAGRARVLIDAPAGPPKSGRSGQSAMVIWSTGEVPADNSSTLDGATRPVKTSEDRGTVFRVVEYAPGVAPRVHRTDSIDYAVVMSGEIDMELDDGVEVHLKAGDVLVQRGTIHNWVNRGTAPCVIAFVLVGARPVEAGGRTLDAVG